MAKAFCLARAKDGMRAPKFASVYGEIMFLKRCSLVMILGSLALGAAEAAPLRLGFELSESVPVGSLKRHATSKGADKWCVFMVKDLGHGHGFRWDIVSYVQYESITVHSQKVLDSNSMEYVSETNTPHAYSTNLNYTYHLSHGQKGLYILAGLGVLVNYYARDKTIAIIHVPPMSDTPEAPTTYSLYDQNSAKPRLNGVLGAGYDLDDHWGVTVRYQSVQFNGHAIATVDGGINFRF